MGKVISITNHKGGVGKSMLTVNLASYLTEYYEKILILDFDPQANTTWSLFKTPEELYIKIEDLLKFSVFHNIKKEEDREKFIDMMWSSKITMSKDGNIMSLIPSSLELAATKIALSQNDSVVYFKIIEAVKCLSEGYNITLIDTPPSIEMLTASAVYASDFIILPIHLDLPAIKGATEILEKIVPTTLSYYSPFMKILGVVVNQYKPTRSQKAMSVLAEETFGEYLFDTVISQSEKVRSLSVSRGTVDVFAPKSKSGEQFKALAREVHERLEGYEW